MIDGRLLPAERMPLTDLERRELNYLLNEAERRKTYKFATYFPDSGPLRRALYPRSLLFFASGKIHRERLFLAANRVGKTESAAYEVTGHLTGAYPTWWNGRKYAAPIEMWAAGDTRETTRDVVQQALFGTREALRAQNYNGMIPAHLIVDRTLKTGVADCIDTAWIQHVEKHHGAHLTSAVQFKSYDQGRDAFQGTKKKLVWLDEEPPDATETPAGGGEPSGNGDIYTECLLRTATEEDGMVIATFTPMRGLTPFVDHYLSTAVMVDATGHVVNAKAGMFGAQS